jgi:hypothetical protein
MYGEEMYGDPMTAPGGLGGDPYATAYGPRRY